MDTHRHRYLYLKSRWKQYHDLQQKQKSLRWQILLGACELCLIIGFMAGVILTYPKDHVLVSVDAPESRPEAEP
jgi:hypothetical protein